MRYWQFGNLSLESSGTVLTGSAIDGEDLGDTSWFGAIGVLLVLIVLVGGIILYLRKKRVVSKGKSFDFSQKYGRRDLIPIKTE